MANKGQDMRPDSDAAYGDSKVVDNVAQHLAEFDAKESSPIPEPPAESADDSKSTPKSEETPAEKDDSTPEQPEGEAAEQESAAIPDNYIRAAIHNGFSAERVAKLYEADPEGTLEFLEQNYNAVNNLSRQFAESGRAAIELQSKKRTEVSPEPKPAPKQEVDMEKLRRQYEDDPFGATAELIKATVAQAQPQAQPATSAEPNPQQVYEENLAAIDEMNKFFNSDEMEAYRDLYGLSKDEKGNTLRDWRSLLPGQQANRQEVLVLADRIIAGAELQRQHISISDALEKAHLIVTEPIRDKIVREKIVSEVQKRSKGITLAPSKSKVTPAATGKDKSEKQAIANADVRLKKLKW